MRAWPGWLARFALTCAHARGAIFGVDDTVPLIASGGRTVQWGKGWDALVVAGSRCVRVNARGIFAKPSHWAARDLRAAGWATVACAPVRDALCAAPRGPVLGTAERPRFDASLAWGGAGCARAHDGRVLSAAHGYDVSACDVLDGGGDLVVCGRTAAYRRTGVSDGVYWSLCLLAILLVRSLSLLVVRRIQRERAQTAETPAWSSEWTTLAACVAVLGLVTVPDGDAILVTEEERLLFWVVFGYTVGYVGLYAAHCATRAGDGADPPIYNLIGGTLQAIAMRLYCGAETPYNPVIVWAIATRALLKLRRSPLSVEGVSTLADALTLSGLCAIGHGSSHLYLGGLFALALLASDVFG